MEQKDPFATTALPGIELNAEEPPKGSGGLEISMDQESARRFLILVVDDSVDNVAMMSLSLQQEGYRVVTATNGEEAIVVAARTKPNLILMDISMPRLDGLGATRRIRENVELRDVPVIAVTAHGTEGFQRAAYDVGVSGYLTKPIDFPRMHKLVARLLSPEGSGRLTRM
jgi:CheY-like chemotaxis protein